MSKVFKDFKDLSLEQFEEIFVPEIDPSKISITGTPNINYVSNRLFMWMFSETDIKDFISIFSLLRQPKQGYIRSEFKRKLESKCKEMIQQQMICPVEPMLYASKTVNKIISNDVEDQEDISDVIAEIAFKTDRNMVVKTLEHILTRWSWLVQLKIALLAAGKIGDAGLVRMAYNRFSNEKNYEYLRYELLKMLIYSRNAEFVPQIVSIISGLNKESNYDRTIVNFFKENFDRYMGKQGLQQLKQYFDVNYEYIKNYGRSIIQKILKDLLVSSSEDNSNEENSKKDFTRLKEMCMRYSKQKDNEDLKKEILNCLFDKRYSIFSPMVYCLRYTQNSDLVPYLKDAIKQRKDAKFSDYKNAILTMAFLRSDDYSFVEELVSKNQDLKYAMYGYYIVQKSETYCTLMADQLLSCDDWSELDKIHAVLKEIIDVNPKLKEIIKARFKSILLSNNKEERKRALLNIQPFWKNLIDKQMLEFIFEQMGYPDKEVRLSSEEQAIVLKIAKEVASNFGKSICKYLDYVKRRSESFGVNIRQLAVNILLNDFEPTAPQ